jgi:Ca2+/Na+ antiporter
MNTISAKRIPIIIAFFFIADIALLVFYLVNQAVGAPYDILTRLLDLNGESSISTWYSVIQLACVAALTGLFAAKNVHTSRVNTWPLLLLPLVFLALSMDELVQIHEWLGAKSDVLLPGNSRLNTIYQESGIWMFLFGIPFFFGILGIAFMLRRYLSTVSSVLPKFLLGLAVFAIGATLIEILSNFVIYGSVWYFLEVVCEEGCEMLGVTIVLWAFHDLLQGHGLSIHLDPVNDQ